MITKAIIAVLTLATIAAFVLFVSSYWCSIAWDGFTHTGRWFRVAASAGQIELLSPSGLLPQSVRNLQARYGPHHPDSRWRLQAGDLWPPARHLDLTFGDGARATAPPVLYNFARQHAIPLWVPVLIFAACPGAAFACGSVRRWRRRRRGRCLECGYNLTGNVSGVCPECGVSVERP